MKKLLIYVCTLSIVFSTYAQFTEEWVSPDDYYGKNAVMIAADADDNAFTLSDIFHDDMYLTKRSPDGTILWATGYDNTTASQWEQASWVTIDINGDAIVTGYTNTGFGSEWYPVQMVVMKFSGADGSLLWRFTKSTGSAYRGRRVLTDASGNIYVGGEVNAWTISYYEVGNMTVLKLDTDGNEIWETNVNEFGLAMAGPLANMIFDNSGNILIAGTTPFANIITSAKLNTDGDVLWSNTFDGYGVAGISSDPLGNVMVMYSYGFGVPATNINIGVKKFNSSGVEQWADNYDFGSAELGRQIICDNSGGAFITGYGSQLSGLPYTDWITFRIDADGNMLWSQRYNEHANNDEWPWMMAKDAADNIYVTGQGGPWPGYFWTSLTQMVTVKYNPDGTEEWVALHTDYSSTGSAICLASDNSVYAAGQGYAVTIRYSQPMPVLCDTPVGLFTNNITSSSARLNWTLVPDAYQYEVWYKKTTAAAWKIKFVAGTKNKLNIKNLKPNTSYVWRIRTICDATGLSSDFSEDQIFTTLPMRIGEFNTETVLKLYPNPATYNVTIEYYLPVETETARILITDLQGNIIYDNPAQPQSGVIHETIETTNYAAGMYVVNIISATEVISKQFIITK